MTFRFFPSKPKPNLDALLEQAKAHRPMTPEEVDAQRQSWVRGEMGLGSDADEAAYRVALETEDTETSKKLDLESEQRVESLKSDKSLTVRLTNKACAGLEEIKRLGRFKTLEDALAGCISNEFFRLTREAEGASIILRRGKNDYKINWVNGNTY